MLTQKNRERMSAIFKMAADKIGKILMFPDFNENLYLGLFWSDELIGNDERCIRMAAIFKNGCRQIGKILIFSDFNEHWYLELFWSGDLIGNDENCIQGNFYDSTVSKMGANKIVKLLMGIKKHLSSFELTFHSTNP